MTTTAMAVGTPEAHQLMRRAHEGLHSWPAGYPGFRARLQVSSDGHDATGTVEAHPGEAPAVVLDEPHPLEDWVREELGMMIGHRWGRAYEQADGQYALTLDDEDGHPLGRRIRVDDRMRSQYRVGADGTIGEIRRTPGPVTFTIAIFDRVAAPEGGLLSRGFTVSHWTTGDAARLTRVDVYRDDHTAVDGVSLPASRRVLVATDAGTELRAVVLSDHVPLDAAVAA